MPRVSPLIRPRASGPSAASRGRRARGRSRRRPSTRPARERARSRRRRRSARARRAATGSPRRSTRIAPSSAYCRACRRAPRRPRVLSSPSGAAPRSAPDVDEDEAARAVRGLGLAGREARLPEERGLLVARDARDRQRLRRAAAASPIDARRGDERAAAAPRSTPNSASSSSSQSSRSRSSSIVREAFVRSVAWIAPVGELPDEPGVDRAERELAGGSVGAREQPLELAWPRSTGRGRARCARARARAGSSAQRSAVRRSCQTMARATGRPVRRSHTTVVSRWFVIPIAGSVGRRAMPASASASAAASTTLRQISSGIVLDPARAAGSAARSPGSRGPDRRSSSSTTRHVVPGRPLVDREDHAALITREVIPPEAPAAAGPLAPGHGGPFGRLRRRPLASWSSGAPRARCACSARATRAAPPGRTRARSAAASSTATTCSSGSRSEPARRPCVATQASTKAYRGQLGGARQVSRRASAGRAARRAARSAGAVRGRARRRAARCRARRTAPRSRRRGARGRSRRARRALGGCTLPDPLSRASEGAPGARRRPVARPRARRRARLAWGRSTRGRTSCCVGPAVRCRGGGLLARPAARAPPRPDVPALELAAPLDGGCLLRIAAASTAILNARVREALACVAVPARGRSVHPPLVGRARRTMHLTPRELDKLAPPQRRLPRAEAARARPAAQLPRGGRADRDAAARAHPRRPLGRRADGPRPAACSAAPGDGPACPR